MPNKKQMLFYISADPALVDDFGLLAPGFNAEIPFNPQCWMQRTHFHTLMLDATRKAARV